jgi:hypothetical protein
MNLKPSQLSNGCDCIKLTGEVRSSAALIYRHGRCAPRLAER